jgi:hypothetical protein
MFAAVDTPQTIAEAYREICAGQDPWIALGDFSHDFFGNFADRRAELVSEPILIPENATPELRQWAAFCAASVEYLCELYAVCPVPVWVDAPQYMLAEPFYTSPLAYKARVRERLEQEAPPAFKRRHVYCSSRVYANKYEQRMTA